MARVAITDTERTPAPNGLIARTRAWLTDASHSSLAQRMAGTTFLVRVFSAALAYLTQVLLARWMGSFEFGVYVYVWTWVLLIGGLFDLGLAQSAQRFIPEYIQRGTIDLLRGFIDGSRWLATGATTAAAVASAAVIVLLRGWLDATLVLPLLLACLCLPGYALGNVQDGIARSYNWLHVGLTPLFILRPLLMLAAMAGIYAAGQPLDATGAMLAAVAATWLTTMLQMLMLQRKLRGEVAPGPRQHAWRPWLAISLPIFMVESFYLLLTYTDILMLKQFRSAEEVAVYHAAAKTLALIAFVNFSVSAAVAHRFTEYHVSGDRARLSAFLADSIKWTFWPSLAATALILALGKPLLWLFGKGFTDGYPVMFVLAAGLLARAAIGPVERLLNMLGQQNVCAMAYAFAFVLNFIGCLILIPRYGGMGAAAATAFALIVESVLLFFVTKRRLGLHVFIWSRPGRSSEPP